MPVAMLPTSAVSAPRANASPSAEPSSRSARFADELGRETALLEPRAPVDRSEANTVDVSESRDAQGDAAQGDETKVERDEATSRSQRDQSDGGDAPRDDEAPVEDAPAPLDDDASKVEKDDSAVRDEWAALEAFLAFGTVPPSPPPVPTPALFATESAGTVAVGAIATSGLEAKAATVAPAPAKGASAAASEGETLAGMASDESAPALLGPSSDGAALTHDAGQEAFRGDSAAGSELPAPAAATDDSEIQAALARDVAEAARLATAMRAPESQVTAAPSLPTPPTHPLSPSAVTPLLDAAIDGVVSMRRDGARWEAEIRLDPAELGSLHVRLEMQGNHLRVVARCDDAQLQQQLGDLFRDWQETLQQQGGGASFDLSGRAKEEEKHPAPTLAGERSLSTPVRARSGDGTRIDLLA